MDVCQFAGARWWKFDFHTHTPASDFRDMITPECWLKAFMKKGIDCVAITDHNSGAWIDPLKQKLEELEESKPYGTAHCISFRVWKFRQVAMCIYWRYLALTEIGVVLISCSVRLIIGAQMVIVIL